MAVHEIDYREISGAGQVDWEVHDAEDPSIPIRVPEEGGSPDDAAPRARHAVGHDSQVSHGPTEVANHLVTRVKRAGFDVASVTDYQISAAPGGRSSVDRVGRCGPQYFPTWG